MHHSYHPHDRAGGRHGFSRMGERLLDYVKSRKADHWIMFAAGLVAGLLLS